MRCALRVGAKTHPHALAYHYAAHAVAMERLGVPIISVRLHAARRHGSIHALMLRRDPKASRIAVENDAVCALIGSAAQQLGCGAASWYAAYEDQHTASWRLSRVASDEAEASAWHSYLVERARVFARYWWHEIIVLAAVLQREGFMDAASVGATLSAFRRNPFRPDLRPLRPMPWELPPPTEPGAHEVELVWEKPSLSQLIARTERTEAQR